MAVSQVGFVSPANFVQKQVDLGGAWPTPPWVRLNSLVTLVSSRMLRSKLDARMPSSAQVDPGNGKPSVWHGFDARQTVVGDLVPCHFGEAVLHGHRGEQELVRQPCAFCLHDQLADVGSGRVDRLRAHIFGGNRATDFESLIHTWSVVGDRERLFREIVKPEHQLVYHPVAVGIVDSRSAKSTPRRLWPLRFYRAYPPPKLANPIRPQGRRRVLVEVHDPVGEKSRSTFFRSMSCQKVFFELR